MIIPKLNKLTDEQYTEVLNIVAEFNCEIKTIHGAHRNIYAIIGDERSETLINRIVGLNYIDRVDRMESLFKAMDINSDLAKHVINIGNKVVKEKPVFMAGHCTIDPKNPNYFFETAHAVKESGADVLRGGVWKPRTVPYSYQGNIKALEILLEAKEKIRLPVITEVMDVEQLNIVIENKIDMIQVGTRNALNYSLLKKIGEKTADSNTIILLKRGRHMAPVNEFLCSAEYIVSNGNPNILLCPRGTMPNLDSYRNHPDESIVPLIKQKTWAPVIVDPSHSVGKAQYVSACALAAMSYGADGLVVETHFNPTAGIGDDPVQSIKPSVLQQLITDSEIVWNLKSRFTLS